MQKLIEIAAVDMTIYKFVLPLMNELKKNGFEISVATNNLLYTDKIKENGYDVHKINFTRSLSPIKNLIALFQLIHLLKKEKPDFVHVHTPIASVIARIACKIAKVPHVIYTLHGLYKEKPFLNIEKFMCKHFTDYIFTVNEQDRIFLIENSFFNPHKIKNLNSVGVDVQKFSKRNIDINQMETAKLELKLKDKPTIGFVGRLVKTKGIVELVEAFIEIKKTIDCQLLLVGSADIGERDISTLNKIKQRIKQANVSKDVIFAGQREDIPVLLSLMDVFVLPSYQEGMAISPLEAMAMELPVVATNIRGCKEEITFETGLLVPVQNVDKLVIAIKQILENPTQSKAMGIAGRKRVKQFFSSKKAIAKQIKIFNRLAG